MNEASLIHERFFSELEALLLEVDQLLQNVDVEYSNIEPLNVNLNISEPNQAEAVMLSYLRMIEIVNILEVLLDKVRNKHIVFNGHINSLIEASNTFSAITIEMSSKLTQSTTANSADSHNTRLK